MNGQQGNLTNNLTEWQHKKILIYGLGRSGRGVARFLAREGLSAEWLDTNPAAEDHTLMTELGFGLGNPAHKYDLVVAAPGVPIDHPDLLALQAAGAEIIGEVVLATRLRPNLPMVGITGTAGKGGTTVLVAHLLRECGVQALEGGNIDPPLLDVVDRAEVAVAELSSFQLERVPGLRLPVAVITNLGIDHLDRHRTREAYHAAKLNITAGQQAPDVLVLPAELAAELTQQPTRQIRAQVRPFSPQALALADGTVVLDPAELPAGIHPGNAAAALLAAEATLQYLGRGVEKEALATALRRAQPVAGRFELVAQQGDIAFIEDSIATRTLAVEAALKQARPPIAWLVGGRDKGAELEPLRQAATGRVVQVIAFGEDGATLAQQLGLPYQVVTAASGDETMQQAVQAALQVLEAAGQGGTVLLSPIGTSFDQFKDYKARGASFTAAARALTGLTGNAGASA